MNKEKYFWTKFVWLTDLCCTSRAGFTLLGYFDDVPAVIPPAERPESDAEHIFGVIAMTYLFQAIYKVGADCAEDAKYLYDTELLHEIGERVIADVPDDGSRDTAEKDRIELRLMREFAEGLSYPAKIKAVEQFKDFQRCDNFAYLMDKFHFVMKQLWYCSKGVMGYMSDKAAQGKLSEQDLMFMDQTDCDLAVVNTAAHFLVRTRGIPGRQECIKVLEEAFMQVFHAVPAALEAFY